MARKFYSSHSHAMLMGRYLHKKTHWEMRRSLTTSLELEEDTSLPLTGVAFFGMVIILCAIHSFWRRKKPSLCRHRVKLYSPKSTHKNTDVKSYVANRSINNVLETIGDGFSFQDSIFSASSYNGYEGKLSQLLLILSGDVELNPGPLNREEDIGE